jgi:hypothetical protein
MEVVGRKRGEDTEQENFLKRNNEFGSLKYFNKSM